MSDPNGLGEPGYRKSSYSESGGCVEVRQPTDGHVTVRNSRLRSEGLLEFTAQEWAAFVKGVKAGEFDPV